MDVTKVLHCHKSCDTLHFLSIFCHDFNCEKKKIVAGCHYLTWDEKPITKIKQTEIIFKKGLAVFPYLSIQQVVYQFFFQVLVPQLAMLFFQARFFE